MKSLFFFVHPTQPESRLLDAFDRLTSPSIPSVKRCLGDFYWRSLLQSLKKRLQITWQGLPICWTNQPICHQHQLTINSTQDKTKELINWTKWPTWWIHLLIQPLILAGSFHGGFPMVFCWHRDAKKAAPAIPGGYMETTLFFGGLQ